MDKMPDPMNIAVEILTLLDEDKYIDRFEIIDRLVGLSLGFTTKGAHVVDTRLVSLYELGMVDYIAGQKNARYNQKAWRATKRGKDFIGSCCGN